MAWSVVDIEDNLLLGKMDTIAMPPDTVVDAINRAESVLGHEWVASESRAKGLAPTMGIVGIGRRLVSLEGVRSSEELIKKIRCGDPSADAELTAIYLFRSHDPLLELELFPSVGSRIADFRLRKGEEQWTTVEVTRPDISKEQERLGGILRRISGALGSIDSQFALEVILRREPTFDEIALLCDHLPEFCRLTGPQRASLKDEVGFLLLNHAPVGHLPHSAIPEIAEVPMIGLGVFFSDDRVVNVRIPFSDDRASRLLGAEAEQLPRGGRGLVMISGPASANELNVWTPLIQRRLQPRIHTRVSGVCLFEGAMRPIANRYDWLVQANLVVNPYAKVALPSWVQTAVTIASEACTRCGEAG